MRSVIAVVGASMLVLGPLCSSVRAQLCGDADASDTVTVTDGVNVLQAAAGLPAECPIDSCDVDGSGAISVSDGVNVLRAAAGLPASLTCVADPFISSVVGQNGVFGTIVKAPQGLQAPPGASQTITNVTVAGFVPGRSNTVTVQYDVAEAVRAAGVAAVPSLFLASQPDAETTEKGYFDLPLADQQGEATITLDLKPNVAVQQFNLKLATGADGVVAGEITSLVIIVIGESSLTCGNRVVDEPDETCDPPGFGCPEFGGGFCNASCVCEELVRFVDNGDGTVTDTQTALQWEKKTGVPGTLRDCTLQACPDLHDVNNTYQWCADLDHASFCDSAGNPADGNLFTGFLATLNKEPCFAGHCDWRLPTVNRLGDPAELETIVDLEISGCGNTSTPCIAPIFGPTSPHNYWSATTRAGDPGDALGVSFFDGAIVDEYKADDLYVRAVRGGP